MSNLQKGALENIFGRLGITCANLVNSLACDKPREKGTMSIATCRRCYASYQLAPEGIVTNIEVWGDEGFDETQKAILVALLRNMIQMVVCPQYVHDDTIAIIEASEPEVRIRLRDTVILALTESVPNGKGDVIVRHTSRRDRYYQPTYVMLHAMKYAGGASLEGDLRSDFHNLVRKLICATASIYDALRD